MKFLSRKAFHAALLFLIGAIGAAQIALAPIAPAQTAGAGIPTPPPALYLGQVSTGSRFNISYFAPFTEVMSKSPHMATDNISQVTITSTNFILNGQTEVGTGGIDTVTWALEYPLGVTCTPITFNSGDPTGSVPDGGSLDSDPLTISIPNGAWYRYWHYHSNPAGVAWAGVPSDAAHGEAVNIGTTGTIPNLVIGGNCPGTTVPNNHGDTVVRPGSIKGMTRNASGFLIGDSILSGYADNYSDGKGNIGTVGRSIGSSFGYINGGVNSDRASQFVANHTKRIAAAGGAYSFVAFTYGLNDFIIGGATAAQIQGWAQQSAALFPGVPFYLSTLTPYTPPPSADSWATTGSQTTATFLAQWQNYNTWVRTGSHTWAAGYLELSNPASSSQNAGTWPVNGNANYCTSDGTHPSVACNQLILNSQNVVPSMFDR